MADIVDGDVYLGAKEADPVRLQLLKTDGITPVPLVSTSEHEVRMRNKAQHTDTKQFSGGDVTVEDEDEGIIAIAEDETDFLLGVEYEYFVTFKDSESRPIRIPKKGFYDWIITEYF